MHFGIQFFRKILFAATLTMIYYSPLANIIILTILNVGMIGYYFIVKPYKKTYMNVKAIAVEGLFGISQGLIATLLKSDRDIQTKISTGWALVVLLSIVVLINLAVVCKEVIKECQVISTKVWKSGETKPSRRFMFTNEKKETNSDRKYGANSVGGVNKMD